MSLCRYDTNKPCENHGTRTCLDCVLNIMRAEIEQLNYDIAFINRTRDVADIKHKVFREDVFAIIDKYRKE